MNEWVAAGIRFGLLQKTCTQQIKWLTIFLKGRGKHSHKKEDNEMSINVLNPTTQKRERHK